MARYKRIGITKDGKIIEWTPHRDGAPNEAWLIAWGKERYCAIVIRYFPSRKGWRLIDIRNAVQKSVGYKSYPQWFGQVRGTRYYPTEDAAVMAAIHMLQREPELDLT